MADITDVAAGLIGGIIVGVVLLLLDWWRNRGQKREDRTQVLGEDLAAVKASTNEIRPDIAGLQNDIRQIQTTLVELRSSTQSEFSKLATAHSLLTTGLAGIERRVDRAEGTLEKLNTRLGDVGQQAREARETAHDHTLFGKKV